MTYQISSGKSPWTLTTQKAALAKLYGVDYASFIATPPRERSKIKRSRNPVLRDKNISANTEKFLSTITSATGLRRNELCKITGDALRYDSSGRPFLHITRGTKGGKIRDAVIIGATPEETEYIVGLFKSAGKMKLLPKVSSAYDNHRYRAEYAKRLYQHFARNIDEIPKKERIYLRKDRKGEILDRSCLMYISSCLGHSRLDILYSNYLYH